MLSLKIAFQFIRKSWIQSLVIVFTVLIGVGVQFFISSLSVILENLLLEQVTTYQEHIIVRINNSAVSYNELDFSVKNDLLNEFDEIKYAIHTSQTQGTIITKDDKSIVFFLFVTDYDNNNFDYLEFNGFVSENIVEGRVNDPTKNEIILDDYFAKHNNLKVGEKITYVSSTDNIEFEIVGTFDLGIFKSVRNFSYISIYLLNHDLKSWYDLNIQINDETKVEEVADKIGNYLGPEFKVTTWVERFPEINMLDLAQRAVVFVIQVLIAVAVFAIILSVLGFMIQQKNKQVGILKAIGIENYKVTRVFIIMTSILSVIGTIIGLIGGTITMHLYQAYMVYPDGSPRFNYEPRVINYIVSSMLVFIAVAIATYSAIRKVKRSKVVDLLKV